MPRYATFSAHTMTFPTRPATPSTARTSASQETRIPHRLAPYRSLFYDSPDIGEIATFLLYEEDQVPYPVSVRPAHSFPSEGCHRHPSAVSDLSSAEHRQVRRFAPDANLYLPRLSPDVHRGEAATALPAFPVHQRHVIRHLIVSLSPTRIGVPQPTF